MKNPQLFLLHFAGGNAYSFEFLRPYLPELEVVALELPGRGKRAKEPLLKEFPDGSRDIYRQCTQRLASSDFLLYGHSLGAYLALRITAMLEDAGLFPSHLIVSGNAGPGIRNKEREKPTHQLERDDFIDVLRNIGGVSDEFIADKELFAYYEPILRADFQMAETNNLVGHPPVKAPLLALMGDQEPNAGSITNWANYTTGTFSHQLLEGGHFCIYKQAERLASIIKSRQCNKISKI